MAGPPIGFERRVLGALEAAPSRIPVVLGGCGTGRTTLLQRLRERLGRSAAQYIDVGRCATTPERFLQAVTAASPFPWHASGQQPATAREAFDLLLVFLDTARAPGGEPCTFLLDEVLELRTFESFPGLRHVLRDLLEALTASANRFVLTTRYVARAHRLLRDATSRFEVMHLPSLASADVTEMLAPTFNGYEQMSTDDRDYLGRAVQALTDGRAAYVRAVGDTMSQMGRGADPISALTALLSRRRRAQPLVPVLLRAAPPPCPRLRRAEGDPGHPRRSRTADADGDLSPPASHARINEGLPVVAGRRRPRHVATEAVQLHRSAAPPLGAPALPSDAADRRRGRRRGAALCAGAPPKPGHCAGSGLRRRRHLAGRAEKLGNHRDRLIQNAKFKMQTARRSLRPQQPPRLCLHFEFCILYY